MIAIRHVTFALALFASVSGFADAAVLSQARVASALASAKGLHRKPSPMTSVSAPYYALAGTNVEGFVSADTMDYGYLANGTDVLIVPMNSGGSGGTFTTLIFTSVASSPNFIGYIPSASGHLDVYIDEGRLIVDTPIYGPNDPNCCPSGHHFITYTIENGRLKKLNEYDAK